MLRILFSVFMATTAGVACADWASGGGELASDGENPWFAHNTKEVPYCIKLDTQYFGTSLDQTRDAIDFAIRYWKESFAQRVANVEISMAKQKFTEVECDEPHLITMQFGILSPQQRKQLGNPRRIVASAVGEGDYDTINLRRHGFIYVSPERGPLALDEDYIIADRWQISNNRLLKLALIHEFGHVFGAQHRNVSGGVMDRYVLANSISRERHSRYVNASTIPQPFNPIIGSSYRQCENLKYLADLIGVKDIPNCFEFASPRRGMVEVYAIHYKDKTRSLIGTFEAQFKGNGAEAASYFILTNDQQVFPNKPDGSKPKGVVAANYIYWEETGTYFSADREIKRQMILNYSAEEINGTVMDTNGQPMLHAIAGNAWF